MNNETVDLPLEQPEPIEPTEPAKVQRCEMFCATMPAQGEQ